MMASPTPADCSCDSPGEKRKPAPRAREEVAAVRERSPDSVDREPRDDARSRKKMRLLRLASRVLEYLGRFSAIWHAHGE